MINDSNKCPWALKSKIEENYHDTEWGRPLHDEERLFEMLILEGQQAGLSWLTILNRRQGMKEAYHNFDPKELVDLSDDQIEGYLQDDRVIKNRLKIKSVITNAKAYLNLVTIYGSLDNFLWSYVEFQPIQNEWKTITDVPAKTKLSTIISHDLKTLGFKFVGPTIIYAYMQSIGMVNDHLITCPSYQL